MLQEILASLPEKEITIVPNQPLPEFSLSVNPEEELEMEKLGIAIGALFKTAGELENLQKLSAEGYESCPNILLSVVNGTLSVTGTEPIDVEMKSGESVTGKIKSSLATLWKKIKAVMSKLIFSAQRTIKAFTQSSRKLDDAFKTAFQRSVEMTKTNKAPGGKIKLSKLSMLSNNGNLASVKDLADFKATAVAINKLLPKFGDALLAGGMGLDFGGFNRADSVFTEQVEASILSRIGVKDPSTAKQALWAIGGKIPVFIKQGENKRRLFLVSDPVKPIADKEMDFGKDALKVAREYLDVGRDILHVSQDLAIESNELIDNVEKFIKTMDKGLEEAKLSAGEVADIRMLISDLATFSVKVSAHAYKVARETYVLSKRILDS